MPTRLTATSPEIWRGRPANRGHLVISPDVSRFQETSAELRGAAAAARNAAAPEARSTVRAGLLQRRRRKRRR